MVALVPMTVFSQASESSLEATSSVAEIDSGSAEQTDGENNKSTDIPETVDTQAFQDAFAEFKAEFETQIKDIRGERLDERASSINWWLGVIAIVLAFMGVVVAIASFVGYRRFREIEEEAKASVKIVTDAAEATKHYLLEIQEKRGTAAVMLQEMHAMYADDADANTEEATQTVKTIRDNPDASPVDKAIANALTSQQQGKQEDAIEEWRTIAQNTEDSDNELAARAWFSVGFLSQDEDVASSISSYDRAIQLKPNFSEAYFNRANAKAALGRHEDAIADYDEAIRLNPNFTESYGNRAIAKAKLGRHEDAIADYDEAIRLKPDSTKAFYGRGAVKMALERKEDAIVDYEEAIRLNPDYTEAYFGRAVAKAAKAALGRHEEATRLNPDYSVAYLALAFSKMLSGSKAEAISNLNTALQLARNSNDVEMVNQVVQILRSLSASNGD